MHDHALLKQAAEASLAEAQAKASERHSQLAQELEEALRNGTAASSRAQELERQVAECQTRIQEGEANLRALTANQGEFMDTYAGQCNRCPLFAFCCF